MRERREFIRDMAWMGALATLTGCVTGERLAEASAGCMIGHALKPMKKIRVGLIGIGMRGDAALRRLAQIPVVEIVALCDVVPSRVQKGAKHLSAVGRPARHLFTGPDDWERVCALPDVDVIYCCTDWRLHAPVARRAMLEGKVALTEVPGAMTVDDCWDLVETSERTRMPCMLLENACYNEKMLAVAMMNRAGLFGKMVYADMGYVHDLRTKQFADMDAGGYWNRWRLKWNSEHVGDAYPTHQLGCAAKYFFGINAGDRFDYLVSMSSKQACLEAYAKAAFPPDDERARQKIAMGDLSVALLRTVNGKMIVLQHSVTSPRPYHRGIVVGTKGCFAHLFGDTDNNGLCIETKPGEEFHSFMSQEKTEAYMKKYVHPLWAGEVKAMAKTVGGHGGSDFVMDLRWAYCLATGQPLDMDVYDLASWSSLVELTEQSERKRGRSVDIPDFTRGAWKTATPLDPAKMTIESRALGVSPDAQGLSGKGQLSV